MENKLLQRLEKIGITDCEPVKIRHFDRILSAVMVHHDYDGLYPTSDALKIHSAVMQTAEKLHLKAEGRGYYTATLVYLEG